MINLKTSFENLFKNNKKRFVLHVFCLGLALLFWIGMFLPFLVGEMIINNHVSLAYMFMNVRGMVVAIYFVMMLLYAYTVLVSSEKNAKSLFLIQAILSTLILGWGIFLVQIGDTGGNFGVGLLIELVVLGFIWFTYLKEDIVRNWIDRFVKGQDNLIQ